ncbi:MAG: esterase/lipase family protein [Gemmatimonadales bacterium]
MRALLVHGMGRSPASMMVLARRLRRAGMTTAQFGYVPAVEGYQRIVDRLVRRLSAIATDPEYIVIGHSLGGLLLRSALAQLDDAVPRPRHLFMLATPNRSPRLARRWHRNLAYRLFTGDAGQLLANADRVATIPPPTIPYTIIAGTSGAQKRWSAFADEPNDWIVGLSEVRLRNDDRVITVPLGHTFMMNYRAVAEAVVNEVGREKGEGRSA